MENVAITDYNDLIAFAKTSQINLAIIGPEQPLVDGICSLFKKGVARLI